MARDPVVHLKGDGYLFEDRDIGCALTASERGKFSRVEWFRFQASLNDSQKWIVPL